VWRAALHGAQSSGVQRLFSMFPTGWPGIGLVLLRVAVTEPLLIDGLNYWRTWEPWFLIAAPVLSLMLILGLFTPVASLAAAAAEFAVTASPCPFISARVLDAVALTLLGPGAYSLDRYCFGRRIVVLPSERR
jgi:putative oxidoreductase